MSVHGLPAEYEARWIAELVRSFVFALMLLNPKTCRIWRAFRDTGGSSREIAAYLGDVSHLTVQKKLIPALLATFASALGTIRTIRGKVF